MVLEIVQCLEKCRDFHNGIRLKKINAMSAKLCDIHWKTWPKCGFLFFFFLSSRPVRFESVTALKYGTWFWMNKITRQFYRVEEVCSFKVFLCVCHIFFCIFDKQVHKILKKNIKQAKKKIQTLNFSWIKRAPKNKCVTRQLWDIGFIFFSLIIWKLAHFGSILVTHQPPPQKRGEL